MRKKIEDYVKAWESRCYSDGIPDEVPTRIQQLNKAPSYKAICMAILKNDTTLKTLGFTRKKPLAYHMLKRIELSHIDKQLKLF